MMLADLPYNDHSERKETVKIDPSQETAGTIKVKSFNHFLEVMKGLSEKNLQK
jgi:hypothetical protein